MSSELHVMPGQATDAMARSPRAGAEGTAPLAAPTLGVEHVLPARLVAPTDPTD